MKKYSNIKSLSNHIKNEAKLLHTLNDKLLPTVTLIQFIFKMSSLKFVNYTLAPKTDS